MANIIVLGSGLVGSVIAKDLSIKHSVSVVDISKKNLNVLTKNIKTYCLDLSEKDVLENLVKDYDLVVGALPGFMGYDSMKRVINSGKNIVDISGRIIMNSEKNEIFNFGKYKNQLVSKVFKTNPEYYHWIMKSDFPQHTKKKFTEIKLRDIN